MDFALKEGIKLIAGNAKAAGKNINDQALSAAIKELVDDAGISAVTNADIEKILFDIFGKKQNVTTGKLSPKQMSLMEDIFSFDSLLE